MIVYQISKEDTDRNASNYLSELSVSVRIYAAFLAYSAEELEDMDDVILSNYSDVCASLVQRVEDATARTVHPIESMDCDEDRLSINNVRVDTAQLFGDADDR